MTSLPVGMSPPPGVTWPEGATSAASFAFDVDAESGVLALAPSAAGRMSVMSHQADGPLVGVPRLLRLLDHHGVRATFFVPGSTAHRYPQAVRDIVAAGHEVAHHGYHHIQPSGTSVSAQVEELDRGIVAMEEVAGMRPVGYRAPMWDLSWELPGLLAERGFLYDWSLMDADAPYELRTAASTSLVEIPIQWALDDWEQYCYLPDISGTGLIASPRQAKELWLAEFHAMRQEGGCWVLTGHPFLSGRPSRAASLGEIMAEVTATPGVWVAALEDIARHTRTLSLTPRTPERPYTAS